MSWPSPVAAQLAGYAFETLLYGCFLVFFAQCIDCLRKVHSPGMGFRVTRFFWAATCILFACITAHWVINTVRLSQALMEYGKLESPGPLQDYITRLTQKGDDCIILTIQDVLWIVEALVGDTILTLRLYSVWNGDMKVVLLPCLLVVSELGFAIAAAIEDSRTNTITVWLLITFGLNVTTNLYCSGLIIYRIWKSSRKLSSYSVSHVGKAQTASRVMIESAGIYAISNVAFVIIFATNSNLQFFVTDPASPAIGLVFCAIIVRARRSSSSQDSQATLRTLEEGHRKPPSNPNSSRELSIEIHVAQDVEIMDLRPSTDTSDSQFKDRNIKLIGPPHSSRGHRFTDSVSSSGSAFSRLI